MTTCRAGQQGHIRLLPYSVFLIPFLMIAFTQPRKLCDALFVRNRIAPTIHSVHTQMYASPKPGTGFGSKPPIPTSTSPTNSKQDDMKSLEAQIQRSIDATKGLREAMRRLVCYNSTLTI